MKLCLGHCVFTSFSFFVTINYVLRIKYFKGIVRFSYFTEFIIQNESLRFQFVDLWISFIIGLFFVENSLLN